MPRGTLRATRQTRRRRAPSRGSFCSGAFAGSSRAARRQVHQRLGDDAPTRFSAYAASTGCRAHPSAPPPLDAARMALAGETPPAGRTRRAATGAAKRRGAARARPPAAGRRCRGRRRARAARPETLLRHPARAISSPLHLARAAKLGVAERTLVMTTPSCLPPADGSSSDDEPLSLLDRLPDDSLHHLLTFVDARSLASFACVSRGAAALAQLPSLWHRCVADQFSSSRRSRASRRATCATCCSGSRIAARTGSATCSSDSLHLRVPAPTDVVSSTGSRRGTSASSAATAPYAAPAAAHRAVRRAARERRRVRRAARVRCLLLRGGDRRAAGARRRLCAAARVRRRRLASAKVRAQICKSLCAPLARRPRARARRSFRRTAGSPAGTASRSATTATTAAPSTARDRSRRSSAPSLASATSSAADSRCARAASSSPRTAPSSARRSLRSRSSCRSTRSSASTRARRLVQLRPPPLPLRDRRPPAKGPAKPSRLSLRAHCALVVITSMKLCYAIARGTRLCRRGADALNRRRRCRFLEEVVLARAAGSADQDRPPA